MRGFPRRVVIAGLTLAALLPSQIRTGTITGRVTDSQGAAVPGAAVTATKAATGVARVFQSNETGNYSAPFLDPGLYVIEVEAKGFKKVARSGVLVQVADQLTLDIQLEVGQITEEITVEASAPLINATSSTLGQVIENRRIVDLPLNGREPFSLAYLSPGVLPPPQPPGAFVHTGGSVPSISGASNFTSEVTIDGMPNTTPRNQGFNNFLIYTPSVDAVEEFKVQTNSMSAEYGRFNGGVVSVVTKSGTNEFHGTAYEFHRNAAFDANNFFNNRAGIPLGSLRRNQFGGSVGGPVILPRLYNGRNRTFFFTDYEGFREKSLSVSSFTVPPPLERRGDFSQSFNAAGQLIRVYDPSTLRPNPAGAGMIRDPFPGNVLPAQRISPIAQKFQEFYPQPTNNRLTGNLDTSGARNNRSDTMDVRIDHNVTQGNRLFGRFSLQNPVVGEPNYWNNPANPTLPALKQHRRSFTLQDTHTLSAAVILNLNYGISRMDGARQVWSYGTDATQYGLPAYFAASQQIPALPVVSVAGKSGMVTNVNPFSSQLSHTAQGTITQIHGNHNLKYGGDYRAYYINQFDNRNGMGSFSFAQNFTQGPDPNQARADAGYGMATFLLGIPGGSISTEPAPASRNSYWAGYVQDDWKLTPRLTINLGLRYELNVPRTERYDRISIFDFTVPSPIAAKVPAFPGLVGAMKFRDSNDRRLWKADKNNFAPRFGFAYRLMGNTTLRGGYGLFFGLASTDASGAGGGFVDGFSMSTSIISSLDGVTPISKFSDPYPDGIRPAVSRADLSPSLLLGASHSSTVLSLATPYFQQWNFSIQQGIGQSLLIEAAYSANKGTRTTLGSVSLNALTPEQMALGAANQQLVTNPFYGVITDPASTLSRPTVARGQLIRPYPQYIGVTAVYPALGSMIYHSAQMKVEKRMSRGFTVLGSYTVGKNINDAGQDAIGQTAGIQDHWNRKLDRSLDPQDVSQRLVASGVWEVPAGRGRAVGADWNRALDLALGGWQFNGIVSFQTGLPLVMSSIGASRPNRIAIGEKLSGPIQQRLNRYFDTSAFAVPAAFTYGNSSRTAPDLRMHGIANYDLSMFKNFTISEHVRAQLRFEAFNAFNRVQFAAPGTQAGSTAFGVINAQQNSPRQLQLALKILF
jgi:hypothetical protein